MSDFPVVTRTADFEGRGGIHTAEGGGVRPVPEPQGVPGEVRAVPRPFPDGFQEDKLRDGGQNSGYVSGHGGTHAEGLGHAPGGKSRTKNTSHLTGDTCSPAGGAHDDESAAVRRNY